MRAIPFICSLLLTISSTNVFAQQGGSNITIVQTTENGQPAEFAQPTGYVTPSGYIQPSGYRQDLGQGQPLACCSNQSCDSCRGYASGCWFGNVEYLAVRPHFSEAVAFAVGQQTPTSISTVAQKIGFDYESSFRTTLGRQLPTAGESLQATYTYLQGNANINGTVGAPGQFIVDPFGNVVGAVVVVDPADARFGMPVIGGDLIQTYSSVNANVVDLSFTKQFGDSCYSVQLDAGARFAEVDQSYRSVITLFGGPVSDGLFTARFLGGGPRAGVRINRQSRRDSRLSLSASMHGSLLLGNHTTEFSNSVPVPFTGSQRNTQARTLPVLEGEIGAKWRINECTTLNTGWLFHSWLDMGVSGGTFGGFFAGADDSSIMSFDGLFSGIEIRR